MNDTESESICQMEQLSMPIEQVLSDGKDITIYACRANSGQLKGEQQKHSNPLKITMLQTSSQKAVNICLSLYPF
jgi:hypothetical protein